MLFFAIKYYKDEVTLNMILLRADRKAVFSFIVNIDSTR